MSTCPILRVTAVEPHPDETAPHLNVVRCGERQFVSMKLTDGTPRYKVGDLAIQLAHGALLPDWLLKRQDVWDEDIGEGKLHGPGKNRIKAGNFRKVMSEGMLYSDVTAAGDDRCRVQIADGSLVEANVGNDAAPLLGVTFQAA